MPENSTPLYCNKNQSIEKRIEDLMSRMTLDEKIAQLGSCWIYELLAEKGLSPEKADSKMKNGIGQITRIGGASNLNPEDAAKVANEIQKYLMDNTRLGIPALIHEESCSGYMARGATCFPQTIGVGSTFSPELAKKMGIVIKDQMMAVGARQALAPLMDVARDARWGRVEETFGEDPYLTSQMGISYIKGLQGDNLAEGIIATGKHFVGYSMSEGGMNWAPPHIPERELREVYLRPFEAAVKEAKIKAIMPAYNELDGVPCHGNKKLLNDLLRTEWGFDGIVVSDYYAITMLETYHHVTHSKAEAAMLALESGVDVELPTTDCYSHDLKKALVETPSSLEVLDVSLRRVLKLKFELGLFENPYVDTAKATSIFDNSEQRELALQIAQKSIVLLKNEEAFLPLKKDLKSIAVIGPNADSIRNIVGDYAYPCHIETLDEMRRNSLVSGTPVPDKVEFVDNFVPIKSVFECIKTKLCNEKTQITFAKGCDVTGNDKSGFTEAVKAAKNSEVAIVIVGDKAGLTDGCTSGEARDRADLNLPGVQQELVDAILDTGTPVVVILVNGRPLSINRISKDAKAIVEAWLPGEEGGQAVVDVLFGDYNPGGKLAMSFPVSVGQLPIYYAHKPSGGRSHWKGDYVEMTTKPLYPFGYGLSYTDFEYKDLVISKAEATSDDKIYVALSLTNSGECLGDEVVQLYVRYNDTSVTRPVKELKGFQRITIESGETRMIKFELKIADLGFYDRNMRFVVEPGLADIMVGSSSQDIRLFGSVIIKAT